MVNLRRIGITVTTAALSLGLVTSVGHAQTTVNGQGGQAEKPLIEVAATESTVSKNDLIKKFKEIFPNKFDYLTSNDFHMSSGHHFPGDDTIRYELSFHKTVQGKNIHGSITFAGEKLEIESFYFSPANESEALFPAKVKEDEAKEIASNFIKKFPNGDQYKLNTNESNFYYFYANQVLTEPIRYGFTFGRTNKDIKISDQQIHVTVLGNGEITEFYRNPLSNKSHTFDETTQLKLQSEVLKKIKENLSVQLQYQINHDYQSGERTVQLVYNPTSQFVGVHALSGDWYTSKEITSSLPPRKSIEKLVEKPLPAKHKGLTVEDVKILVNELLKVDSEDVTLTINHVGETTNYNGKEVYVVDYSYEYKNGGYGTSIEIDKQTGEIIQYHDMRNEVLNNLGKDESKGGTLTSAEALSKAIAYLKEWVPSYLHNYAKPIAEPYVDQQLGSYSFTFPRVVNGIAVTGDEISISINSDGKLSSLYVNQQNIEEWPQVEGALSNEKAKERYLEAIGVELLYMKHSEEDKHYSLVYVPTYNKLAIGSLDATSGEWISHYGQKDSTTVSHPTAANELNYLIQNKILDVKDPASFNANEKISKGEALSVLVKSLSYFYDGMYPEQEEKPQSFENIGPDNKYYNVVERAVTMGILDASTGTFDTEAKITREELAVWYIKALGLEQAAKHKDIYKVNVKDADEVTQTGYVALATALEILPTEDGKFSPKKEVTYADVAVSTIRLAHKAHESGVEIYY
ncbi:YcdB/YcdC domain-containing protein [Lysinibacillus sp. BW-2-10]|uniref:YcdB/YcdC domain-containing protein n=1 Tax=Lysinibacillus sp. BW-2-10 TaxID=2590030 RepID=UPI0011809D16|nr:YcdB/YcdC domain-containing protein [Lysinibacillus sp. BW-2-10]TSI04502.1 S-layer homology domain-containing protein [Lysinibacillus sp. BW-2-10]